MKKKLTILMTVLSVMVGLMVACTPTGGEPEAGAPVVAMAAPAGATNAPAGENEPEEDAEFMRDQTLEGVRWVLLSYLNAAGETVDVLANTEPTAEFSPDGQMGGHGSCNSYFAEYTVDGQNLTIGEIGRTLMLCDPPELMEQEDDFTAALHNAATFAIEGDRLEIYDANGATLLTFEAGEQASLSGTEWTASMVNNGREAVTNVVADTNITANFAEDGSLSGSAGCNNYMGSYTLDGQNITISPLATTRKLCPEPEGVMDQEAAFVAMMAQAATYSISGDTLELRTADGALVASFTAAN